MSREFFRPSISEEENKGLKALYDEAVTKYEEALGVPPPEDWTAEQVAEAVEKKTAQQDKILSEIHRPSSLKSRRSASADRRGHRRGLKPAKPREQKKAA